MGTMRYLINCRWMDGCMQEKLHKAKGRRDNMMTWYINDNYVYNKDVDTVTLQNEKVNLTLLN